MPASAARVFSRALATLSVIRSVVAITSSHASAAMDFVFLPGFSVVSFMSILL
jgi:hypothetical protein